MHRADHATRAQDLHGAGLDGYTEGNPLLGVPATVVTGDALNAFQEELANAVEGRGIVLDKNDNTQLYQALGAPLEGVRELVRPDLAELRCAVLHPHHGRPGWDATLSRPEWALSDPGTVSAYVAMASHSGSGRLACSATAGDQLPYRGRVVLVQALLQQAAAHAEGDRMMVRVSRLGIGTAPDVLETVAHPGGTVPTWVSSGALDIPFHAAQSPSSGFTHGITVTVFGGVASAPVGDQCHLVLVHYEAEIL